MANNKVDTLHPLIREEVREEVNYINTNVLTGRVKMRVTQANRSFKEQGDIYATGRTKPGKIVTKAKPGQSIHNYALAFDFCLVDGKTPIWDTAKDFDGDKHPDWLEIVQRFEAKGYKWGGRFRSISDKPHLEKTFGHTWQQLLALVESGQVDKDGYVILKK